MITIWNRKELTLTMSMRTQMEIREILSANGIDYDLKTTNLQSASFMGNRRGYAGFFGAAQDYMYEYKFYLHRKDYETAKYLIGR